jgi:TPR repeat protein
MKGHLTWCLTLAVQVAFLGLAYAQGAGEGSDKGAICGEFLSDEKVRLAKSETMEASTSGKDAFKLGLEHQLGTNGRAKDLKLAKAEYQRSAKAGYQDGMFAYAALVLRMASSDTDAAEAYVWFKKLADVKHPGGLGMMALAFKSGAPGINRNLRNYEKYIEQAAWLGEVSAQVEYLALLNKKTLRTTAEDRKRQCLEFMLR